MIVEDIIRDNTLVNDNTRITILERGRTPIASGNWFQDQILDYSNSEVVDFSFDAAWSRVRIRIREADLW